MGMFNSPGTSGPEINNLPGTSQDFRGLLRAKITSRNTPATGPLKNLYVYEWTEQAYDSATGLTQDADMPRKGIYTDETNFANCIIDLNNNKLQVGLVVWARMKGAAGGLTIYETFTTTADETAAGGGGSCCDTSWIGGVPPTACLNVVFMKGKGSCSCILGDLCAGSQACAGGESYQPTPMAYINNGDITGWVSTAMKNTCCGCGMAIFHVIDGDAGTASLRLDGFHVSCADGRVFNIDLIQESCCTIDIGCCDSSDPSQQPTAQNGVTFRVKSSDLPLTCNGVAGNCGQNFKVWVGCGSCPPVFCDCCCLAQTAPAWYYRIPDGSFADSGWDGTWVLTHDVGCKWIGSCNEIGGSGSGSGVTDAATLQYITSGVYRLTHNGSVYELDIASWKCCQSNAMARVSGTEGPNPLTVYPILPGGVCSECTPPDEIKVTFDSHGGCPSIDGTYTLTKHGSGSTATWDYTAPGGTTVGVLTVDLSCSNSNWQLAVSGQCDPLIPAPFTASVTAKPNTQSFGPFEVIWTGQNIAAGGNPGPVPACCNDCTGCLTVDVYE